MKRTITIAILACLSLTSFNSCKKHKEEKLWKTYWGHFVSNEKILLYEGSDTLYFDDLVLQEDYDVFATIQLPEYAPGNVFNAKKTDTGYDYQLKYTRTLMYASNSEGELIDYSQSYQDFNNSKFFITKVGEDLDFVIHRETGTVETYRLERVY